MNSIIRFFFFFLFALTNFLVIVFSCKHRRPAVNSLKMENGKESEHASRL